jgi:hypothetical protein
MNNDELLYKQKYLKYKQKYLELKAQQGGSFIPGYYFIFYNSNELNTFESNDSEKKEFVQKLKNKSYKLNDKTIPFGKFSKIFKSGIYFKNKSKEPKMLAFQIPGFSKVLSMLSSNPEYMKQIKSSLKSNDTNNIISKQIDNLSVTDIQTKFNLKNINTQFELNYNLIRDNKNELIDTNQLSITSQKIIEELMIPGIDSVFIIEGTIKSGNKFIYNETFSKFTNNTIKDTIKSLDAIKDSDTNDIQVGGNYNIQVGSNYNIQVGGMGTCFMNPICGIIELIAFLIKIFIILPGSYIINKYDEKTKK